MAQPTTAVILAAGKGDRLSDVLPDRPKGFLDLNGQTLIERSIQQLRSVGVQDIIIVTGYGATFYEDLAHRENDVVLVHNPDFATTGNMYSLYCAREYIHSSFLLLESDLIYENRALTVLMTHPKKEVVLLSGLKDTDDGVYVYTQNNRIVHMSKKQNDHPAKIEGKLVGIVKLSLDGFKALVAYAEERFTHDMTFYYEFGLTDIAETADIHHHKIEDLVWAEIDTLEHLEWVKQDIIPRLNGL